MAYTYQLSVAGLLTRDDGASIPQDPANADYAAYLAWLAAGNPAATLPAPTLAQAQANQVAALRSACDAAIVGGFQSSALGSAHTYPSGTIDQINLMGSVTASLLPGVGSGWSTPFWCADTSSNWSWQNHTAAQIQQAGADGKAWVVTCQTKLATLTAEVAAATTIAAVEAITW